MQSPKSCISRTCDLNIPQKTSKINLLIALIFPSLYFILQRDLETNQPTNKKKKKKHICM